MSQIQRLLITCNLAVWGIDKMQLLKENQNALEIVIYIEIMLVSERTGVNTYPKVQSYIVFDALAY